MSTSGSGTTWRSLLDEKRHEVKECFGQDYWVSQEISNGRTFRTAFEKFARRQGDYKFSKLEAKLFPSITPISELSRLVDHSTAELKSLAPNKSLEGLVWWILYAIIESGCSAGAQLTPLVALIAELSNKIPRFSTTIGGNPGLRFPNEKRVQQPLQDVYSLFISSLVFIISYLKGRDNAYNRDPTEENELKTYIAQIASRIEAARGKYDVMISQAAEDEERKKAHQEQPSLKAQSTLPDLLHDNSTANRVVQVQFLSHKILGEGSYGEVDEVRELSTGAVYARKHIHLDSGKASNVIEDEVKNEVAIMQKLRHLHIATVLFYLKEEETYSIFMLPVADHDLKTYLDICIEKEWAASLIKHIYPWFGCLLDALAYAHKLNIKHQDIKPSNILIKENRAYLSDFGLAKDFTGLDTSASHGHRMRGNRLYRAPEVVPNQERTRKADVFSLGCVYSEMFTITQGKSLKEYHEHRHGTGEGEYRDCIGKVETWLMKFEREGLRDLLVDEILWMTKKDTAERHTAEQAMHFLKSERALFCVE